MSTWTSYFSGPVEDPLDAAEVPLAVPAPAGFEVVPEDQQAGEVEAVGPQITEVALGDGGQRVGPAVHLVLDVPAVQRHHPPVVVEQPGHAGLRCGSVAADAGGAAVPSVIISTSRAAPSTARARRRTELTVRMLHSLVMP